MTGRLVVPTFAAAPMKNQSLGGFRATSVESRRGAVSHRFLSPLIKLDVPISGIQLSDWLHLAVVGGAPI
jgi:hypothetical protein